MVQRRHGARLAPARPCLSSAWSNSAAAELPPEMHRRRLIPVSIKTRVGYEVPEVENWIPRLLELEPAAIAVHGRTLRQAYGGHADWDKIAQAAAIARGSGVAILGNGDVQSWREAQQRTADCGLDGVLIGRAACGNPFVFEPWEESGSPVRVLDIAVEHVQRYEAAFVHLPYYHFPAMRKHLAWYAHHAPGGAALRRQLLQVHTAGEAILLLRSHPRHMPSAACSMRRDPANRFIRAQRGC